MLPLEFLVPQESSICVRCRCSPKVRKFLISAVSTKHWLIFPYWDCWLMCAYVAADKKIVITNDINLSKGRDTFQSSTLWNGESGRAVDGNRNGIFRMKSCTHTGSNPRWQNTPNPWWAVDLGASKMISAVRITTRSDCCHDRLNGFEIRIGNIKPKGRGDQNSICQSDLNIRRGETYQFSCPMKGRYVSIRIPGHGKILTLCEVEVLGEYL